MLSNSTPTHESVACFLLEHSPLNEMNESMATVVENYRFEMLHKQQAIDILVTDFRAHLNKYIKADLELSELLS